MQHFLTVNMLVTRYRLPVLVHHVGDLTGFKENIFVHSRYRDALLFGIKANAQAAMNLFAAARRHHFTVNTLLLLLLLIKARYCEAIGYPVRWGSAGCHEVYGGEFI